MEKTIRIALAQINPTVGDLHGNAGKILAFMEKAFSMQSDIVVFGELALCGYPPEDLLLKQHFVRDNLSALKEIVNKVTRSVVIIGFVDSDKGGAIYNAAGIIQNKRLCGVYHKLALPNYGVFDEKRYFHAGSRIPLVKFNDVLFGINICEDIWQTRGLSYIQAQKGAKCIINISASPFYAGKAHLRRKTLQQRAHETKTHICYTNLVGGQDELVFDGGSAVFGPDGTVLFQAHYFEEELLVADITFRDSHILKPKTKAIQYIALSDSMTSKKMSSPITKAKSLERVEEIYRALVLGTRDYILKNGFEKAVIGLSGGIDSALTAAIACDAIGNDNVIAVGMPSRFSSKETKSDAGIIAGNLDIQYHVIPISAILDSYDVVLKKVFTGRKKDVTEENLQARIRGNILMALSNKFGWLVLTTGNKSETSVGYCTLYGDMAGGFAVIKDVPKTLVYELAEYINKKYGRNIIPASVISREPSAELRPHQKDQDSLPEYPVLDKILEKYVEQDYSYENIVRSTKINSNIIKDVILRVDRNEYKRRQAPPGIKITPKSFGKDRRLAITNKYKEF